MLWSHSSVALTLNVTLDLEFPGCDCTFLFRSYTFQECSAKTFRRVHSFTLSGFCCFSEYGWCFVFNSTFTLLLWQEGKGECMAARCKGTRGRGTWQVSDLIPFPSGQHTSSAWQSVREQVPMDTWQSMKIWWVRTKKPHVLRYSIQVRDPIEKQTKKALQLLLCNALFCLPEAFCLSYFLTTSTMRKNHQQITEDAAYFWSIATVQMLGLSHTHTHTHSSRQKFAMWDYGSLSAPVLYLAGTHGRCSSTEGLNT